MTSRAVINAPSSAMAPPSWVLPAPAARIVFGALPVGERLRCREVCPAWRDALDADPPTWEHLDMRPLAALSFEAQGMALRAAAARARGRVRTLALAVPDEPRPEAAALAEVLGLDADEVTAGLEATAAALRRFLDEQLLPVLCDNSATLLQLSCVTKEGSPAPLQPALVRELLAAAPRLRSLHCELSRTSLSEADVGALLRREGDFAAVRLSGALVFLAGAHERDALEALKAHDGMEELVLIAGPGASTHTISLALDAAAAARVPRLTLTTGAPVSCGALARLLRAGALRELFIANSQLTRGGVAALAEALRASALKSLTLLESKVMEDEERACRLLAALVGHETLEHFSIELDPVPEAARGAVGAALAALVGSNPRALKQLSINGAELGEEALQPLTEALGRNTHLERLDLTSNNLDVEFFKRSLAPAVRRCASLRDLPPLSGEERPLERVLAALERAAAKDEREAAAAAAAQ